VAVAESPVHAWFALSYASYLVLPRSVMQAMPADWQERAVALMEQVEERFGDLYGANEYCVKLRGENGRFVPDPLANYRHPPAELMPEEVRAEP
jgi:hypothetical protein